MKDRRRITDRIEDSAASDRNYKGVPIDRALRKDLKQVGSGFRIVLADFASRDRYKSDQIDGSGVRRSVVFDLRSKIRKRCQDTFVNTNQTSASLQGSRRDSASNRQRFPSANASRVKTTGYS